MMGGGEGGGGRGGLHKYVHSHVATLPPWTNLEITISYKNTQFITNHWTIKHTMQILVLLEKGIRVVG